MSHFSVKEIDRLRYRPTKTAEEFLGYLRSELGLNDKATAARLAIARSVAEPVGGLREAIATVASVERGMAIEGVHLFGDDSDLWGCVVAASSDTPVTDPSEFRAAVEFHWHRGAELLQRDYISANRSAIDFIVQLAGRVPRFDAQAPEGRETVMRTVVSDLVRIQLLREAAPWDLNAAGGNGLMVISGRPGSGKSQLALDLLAQASSQGVRFLFFDLKGELEESAESAQQQEKRERFLDQTKAKYIRLISAGLPINPFYVGTTRAETAQIASEIAHLVRCFASQLGANQERLIREAYEDLAAPSVDGLVEALRSRGEEGVALSILEKIDAFGIFAGTQSMSIDRWLESSVVIDFKGLGNDNETKALVVAFVLNAIMRQLNRQLPVVNGVQPLQMILFVDEAHLLLPKEGRAGLLGSLARQGRAWGFPVWLASQDADAFVTKGQHATDFAELADCGVHLSPSTLTEAQQRQILGQVLHKRLGDGEGVLRLKGATTIGRVRQFWMDRGMPFVSR